MLDACLNMRILMNMSTRNVYVSADDAPLFDRAAVLAGSLSAAVAAGLRLYVAQSEKEHRRMEMQQIELEVQEGAVVTTRRFTGRRLLRYEDRTGARVVTYRVYVTARAQLAVYRRDDPDWGALSSPDGDAPVWNDSRTWDAGWWRTAGRTLQVFPDVDAMAGCIPEGVVAATRSALETPAVEDLDI